MEPISKIDSSTNQLFFRGIDAIELAKESDYESVFYLLLHGSLPSGKEREDTKNKMISFRDLYSKDMDSLQSLASKIDSIIVDNALELEDALLAFVSLSGVVAASSLAESNRIDIQESDSKLDHAANFLWIATGKESPPQDISDFQSCLILHMDDPDNPSLTALSKSIMVDRSISEGLTEALAKHVDTLHHGAGSEAMRMFNEVKNVDAVREYLKHRIESGQKIFGMGHRIYRGFDPRALVLRNILRRRANNTNRDWLVQIIEEVAKEGSSLLADIKEIKAYPNVDLYNAATYTTFGFSPEFNTTLFAIARAAGWSAHILELLSD